MKINTNIDLTDEQIKEIGMLLTDYVVAGEAQISGCNVWWEQSETVHLAAGGPSRASSDGEDLGYEVTHRPLSQPRLDALTAQICTVVGGQRPYMNAVTESVGMSEGKSELVHRALSKAGFQRRIRNAANICGDTDLAFYRLAPNGPGKMELTVHHPRDVIVFPALPSGMDDVVAIGHKIPKPRRYILSRRKKGEFYRVPLVPPPSAGPAGDSGMTDVALDRSGASSNDPGPAPALDSIVNLYDLVVRMDLSDIVGSDDWGGEEERWYRATICKDDHQLLALEEYNLATPWYFTSRYIGSLNYYPPSSVGRNLLSLQSEYSNLWSLHRLAVAASAGPAVIGPAGDVAVDRWKPFDVIDSDEPASSYFSPTVNANVSQIPGLLQMIQIETDGITRLSGNSTGRATRGQTATQTQVVAAGEAVGIEAFIDEFTADFPRMADLVLEIVEADYEAYQETLKIVDAPPPSEPKPVDPMQELLAKIIEQLGGGAPGAPAAPGMPELPIEGEGAPLLGPGAGGGDIPLPAGPDPTGQGSGVF